MPLDMVTLILTRPDDWHLHLRDGEEMRAVLPDSARRFARALIMPNLTPPVTTVARAHAYRERILAALPPGMQFDPLMTLYLTDNTQADEIARASASGFVRAVKFYPAGATTNADSGVSDIGNCEAALAAMQELGVPLLVHGEMSSPDVDIFDRECIFIERVLTPLVARFRALRIVLEHITTKQAVAFVGAMPDNVAATITAHHLLLNRNALFQGGIRPHHYCLPVLKREEHRRALLAAATSGNPKFFLGTDSAPHAKHTKEIGCGCAGIYTAHAGIEFYAEAFESVGALDKLEAFASFFGADFYGLARNSDTLRIHKQTRMISAELQFGSHTLVPLRAGEAVHWSVS